MKSLLFMLSVFGSLMALEPLVDAQWLKNNQQSLRIVEVSDGDSYSFEHIPGAVHTSIGKWRFDNGTFISIRPIKEIENEISRLGIDKNSQVVLYAPINEPKDLLKSSYVYWALQYHGVKNVALLDGGLASWKKNNLPLSSEETTITPSVFKASIDPDRIANIEYVKQNLGKLPMIDARPGDMYLGVTPTPTVKRSGHIQGAMSYSWNYSVDKDYILKSKEMLRSVFEKGYGLNATQEAILYCTGGLETSFNYFVLSGVLGHKNIRLYDASMKEWGNREETPMSQFHYETFKY